MIWRGEAATDTLRLNNMQVQAGYEVINESSCNGFCTPWDDRRVAQCNGNVAVSRNGCGQLGAGCIWRGGADQCFRDGLGLKVNYCGQLCPKTVPTNVPSSPVVKVYCDGNTITQLRENGNVSKMIGCGQDVCVSSETAPDEKLFNDITDDKGQTWAGCRESCANYKSFCSWAGQGTNNNLISGTCEIDKQFCFYMTGSDNSGFVKQITCSSKGDKPHVALVLEKDCRPNSCNGTLTDCGSSPNPPFNRINPDVSPTSVPSDPCYGKLRGPQIINDTCYICYGSWDGRWGSVIPTTYYKNYSQCQQSTPAPVIDSQVGRAISGTITVKSPNQALLYDVYVYLYHDKSVNNSNSWVGDQSLSLGKHEATYNRPFSFTGLNPGYRYGVSVQIIKDQRPIGTVVTACFGGTKLENTCVFSPKDSGSADFIVEIPGSNN